MAMDDMRSVRPSPSVWGWIGVLLAVGVMASLPVATQQKGVLEGAAQAAASTAGPSRVTPDMPFPPASPDPEAIAAAKQRAVAALLEKTSGGRLVPVIVGVDAPFMPEGHLDPDSAVRQRATMATARDEILSQMSRGSVGSIRRYETIPYFAALVDADALQTLNSLPGVTSVVEDRPRRPALMDSTGIVQATTVWQYGVGGAGWAVAILDSGVDKTHPFLANKVVAEACFSGRSGTSSSLCPGGATSSTAPGSGVDCRIDGCDHGTHLAGIAAGRGGSFSGVARDASIISIQILRRDDDRAWCDSNGYSSPCVSSWLSDEIAALEHVYALRNSFKIAAVNLSIGGGGSYSSQALCDAENAAEKRAIDNLRSVGIATVAASGNDGSSSRIDAPACISTAVSVGSTTKQDAVATSSNTAPFLSLLAPGSSIYSSVPGGGYQYKSGTSMAAPHVAGAWAILKSIRPSGSVADLLAALRGTGKPVADPLSLLTFPRMRLFDAAVVIYNGGGGSAPGAPSGLTASASGSNVALAWTAPASGGAPTTYTIEAGSGPGLANLANFSTGNTATTFAAGGVGNGTYYVRVRATNSVGTSGPSNEAIMIVGGGGCTAPPGAAAGLTITQNSGGSVAFRWSAAQGGPTTYILEAGSAPGLANLATVDIGGTGTTFATSGVGAGTYYVRVRARNACGASGPSNEVVLVVAPTVPPQTAVIEFRSDASTCRCTYGTIVITIDGSRVGTMSCTGSASFTVTPGTHTYSACDNVSCWPGSSSVTLSANDRYAVLLPCR